MPQTAKAQHLHPKMMPFQIFQHASNSKSSKPTSRNGAFSNRSRCLKQQKLKPYIPKPYLSESSNIRKMPKAARTQKQHPKMLPFQIFQVASNSKRSRPTFQDVTFAKLPRCLKQQQLKTYIPKWCLPNLPRCQNNKSSKPTSQNFAFPNLPRCLKRQKLKNLPPKMMPFQIFLALWPPWLRRDSWRPRGCRGFPGPFSRFWLFLTFFQHFKPRRGLLGLPALPGGLPGVPDPPRGLQSRPRNSDLFQGPLRTQTRVAPSQPCQRAFVGSSGFSKQDS